MEPIRDERELVATLESLRPGPRDEFIAELDERAGAGFPPASRPRLASVQRLRQHLVARPRRRLPAIAAGAAVSAIAVATAVIAVSEGPQSRSRTSPIGTAPERLAPTTPAGGAGGVAPSPSRAAPAGTAAPSAAPASGSGPYAAQAERRKVEHSTSIVLEAPPSELRADAARVFDAVREYDGIVLHSSVSGGPEGGNASFDLLLPTARLGDAVATLSEIADVVSRQDSSQDVTARSIGLSERLADARARVAGLLHQLADAETEAQRSAAEAELHIARRRLAAIRSRLSALERRVHLSSVSLRIEGDSGAAGSESSWGIGDALRAAGHVLAVAAGVTLVALAGVALPALIILLLWLGRRALVRRSRKRALDSAH